MQSSPTSSASTAPAPVRWHISEIDFSRIDIPRIRHNQDLFYLVTSASFIETVWA